MRDERLLTQEDVRTEWKKLTRKLPFWVRDTVLTMGLPPHEADGAQDCDPPADKNEQDETTREGHNPARARPGRPGGHAVREALARDRQLGADVLSELGRAYWKAVERGDIPNRIPAAAIPSWAYRVAQRATWRYATPRAEHLLNELPASAAGGCCDYDRHSAETPDPEQELSCHETGAFVRALVAQLPAQKREALLAKLNGTYAELSAECSETEETLRKRAERTLKEIAIAVRKRLRE